MTQQPVTAGEERRSRWLLALGMGAGMVLAAIGIAGTPAANGAGSATDETANSGDAASSADPASAAGNDPPTLEAVPIPAEQIVALVNGHPLLGADLQRMAGQPGESAAHLQTLIDQELLLQYGLKLGLERREHTARGAIIDGVLSTIAANSVLEPDDATLRKYFTQNKKSYPATIQLKLQSALFATQAKPGSPESLDVRTKAQRFAEAARGAAAFEALRQAQGAGAHPRVPGAAALADLQQRLGVGAAESLGLLKPQEVSNPLFTAEGWVVVKLVGREELGVAAFADVRERLRRDYAEWSIRTTREAFLARLRSEARIERNPTEAAAAAAASGQIR